MKVLPFKIPKAENNALIYQVDQGEQFYNRLHQHEEIQISLILSGEGDLVVGDTVNRYQVDDLFVIGSNVPHLFRSDLTLGVESHMITLFFTKKSFGNFFFELLEMRELESFFKRIASGIRLNHGVNEIKGLFFELEKASHLERFISFLKILKHISIEKTSSLSSFIYSRVYSDDEGDRMSNVMNYAISNFSKDITLDEVSNIANMSPNAFCRYFKQRTNKTYFEFLMEIRCEHACRLLLNSPDRSIATIAEASGFRNISNFNRKFKTAKSVTPSEFRAKKSPLN